MIDITHVQLSYAIDMRREMSIEEPRDPLTLAQTPESPRLPMRHADECKYRCVGVSGRSFLIVTPFSPRRNVV